MKRLFHIIFFLIGSFGFSQDGIVHSVYFDTDIHTLKDIQKEAIQFFLQDIDTTRLDNISVFGYCDDVGKVNYNYKLSQKRANTLRDFLNEKGIKKKIFVTIEGKGKILIDEDLEANVPEARAKNRRVDIQLNFKPIIIEELKIPGLYDNLRKDALVGDRIYLEKVYFERGSSKLTNEARKELNKIVEQLFKYRKIHLEIQGHVCCTPKHLKDAVDRETDKRELSVNRAKRVFLYFISKGISSKRLTYKGYGISNSLGKTANLDRRVELVVTKN